METPTLKETITVAIGCLIIGIIAGLIEQSFISIIIFGISAAITIIYYIMKQTLWRNAEILERDICKKLDKSGFRHEKLEGELCVYKNDSRFQIQLGDSYNRRIKHLIIYYKFQDENSSKISIDGWSRASNVLNINHTDTIFVALEDHFCCCYQTSIGNPRDFMKEFDRAYDAIGEVMVDYGKLFPYLERDYPNRIENNASTSIGFKQI